MIKNILGIPVVIVIGFFLALDLVYASDLTSPNYRLEIEDVSFQPQPSRVPGENKDKPKEVKVEDMPIYDEKGYLVKEGFDYGSADQAFSLSLEPTFISYDTLFPDQPVTKTVKLQVNPGGGNAYQVLTAISDDLKSSSGIVLPGTNCDQDFKCSPTNASRWDNPTTHGLGFSVAGEDALPDFDTGKFFRPFANLSTGQSLVQIISGFATMTINQKTSNLIVKLDVSEKQPSGIYQSTLYLTALPSY